MTTRNRRTALRNRVGLALVGLVLLLAGAAGLARGLNLLPRMFGPASGPVIDPATVRFGVEQKWFWPALAVVAIVLALLALWWLASQTRVDSLRNLRLEPDSRQGVTNLPGKAVTAAIENDLADSPYLHRGHARLTGSAAHPRLHLHVVLDHDADPAAARARIDQALARVRQAVELDELPTTVELTARR
ncbi:hypothetical protein SAMN05421678_108130 [Actinopolymorpha cephalotaxi]|uniref:Alkaline shock response membrane anchor protein AmaP n=1 Tax=Actinopolymorpha cephalotaxi TaxID=504797 RepID=A0A1I2UDH4_9ACTN|nr:alkaline shock response membrane anchor protein AmaP [Actinopolymorpha cephalotaxi]NYH86547.1 hypothetical protein [Actinopolymorpha cephalotaxi]SFG75204.1 hypothetical protein SAMN05421678_108130 [Actinopolymorpha cephalotaxi]